MLKNNYNFFQADLRLRKEIKMKVLLVNGGPHKNGCTATALKEIEDTLNKQGIETENFWLGTKPISGCIGCRSL